MPIKDSMCGSWPKTASDFSSFMGVILSGIDLMDFTDRDRARCRGAMRQKTPIGSVYKP